MSILCAECGHSFTNDENYCPLDGSSKGKGYIEPDTCPTCGTHNKKIGSYCHHCGTYLKDVNSKTGS